MRWTWCFVAKWFAPVDGGYRATNAPESHGPPSETPSTQRPAVATPSSRDWYLVQQGATDSNNVVLQWWVEAVSRILLDLRERGVELEVPAQPDVPYQQYN